MSFNFLNSCLSMVGSISLTEFVKELDFSIGFDLNTGLGHCLVHNIRRRTCCRDDGVHHTNYGYQDGSEDPLRAPITRR
jgi:hypothetical protein